MASRDFLGSEDDFSLLSLPDLLAAREQFHRHLIHKPNVVATAVGRYLIRHDDPWPGKENPTEKKVRSRTKRTLSNSEVRPYSWPAILVFVENWASDDSFKHPQEAVPSAVYMADGQKVPICVVEAEKDELRPEEAANYNFPASIMGGGYPVICDLQGREHVASVACLVTNGNKTYALTNRHVAGEPGTVISAIVGRNKNPVGVTAQTQLTRKLFTEIYPGWHGDNIYVDLDVGLIEIDDLNQWTTQVYGVGEIGPLADLDVSNISLSLIDCPVRGYGAASGDMRGQVKALFYRYKSVGGFEYVADLLIGPRKGLALGTHPGDSGTLWLTDIEGDKLGPRPIAMQWGGQVFMDDTKQGSSYALATFLSTACNELDIAPLRGWNIGLPEYWGAVGHYSIANKACRVIRNQNLKQLMQANLDRITYDIADITKKNMQGLSKKEFVPLADVPDMVWKVGPHKRGGMKAPEHANHFADMDRKLDPPQPGGATLLAICNGKPDNVSVPVWQHYYDAVKQQFPKEEESRGLLPFRCWQIYDQMVSFVRAGEVDKFVCAAGIISHYVGDSCQPLHISYMFNGDPDDKVMGTVRNSKTHEKEHKLIPRATGVHSAYEDDMVDRHVDDIITGVDAILGRPAKPALVTGGHAAAVAVVNLMQQTFAAIAPKRINAEFVKTAGQKPAARADAMWKVLGQDTIKVMADGCICLAQLWDSAWKEGGGDHTIHAFGEISEKTLEKIYQNPDFLPSHTLNTIGPLLKGQPAAPSSTAAAKKKRKPKRGSRRMAKR
jgi:hypothetical protein